MGIPLAGAHMAKLMKIYRDAWTAAGHPGRGKVMLAFHMFCADPREGRCGRARAAEHYLKSIVDAASEWMSGISSRDYPNYQKMIETISRETFELQVAKGAAWIGTPDEIRNDRQLRPRGRRVRVGVAAGEFRNDRGCRGREVDALFAREVMPYFRNGRRIAWLLPPSPRARRHTTFPPSTRSTKAARGVNSHRDGCRARSRSCGRSRPEFVPAHWRWEDAKVGLDAAGRLIDVSLAERRNLVMRNPAPAPTSKPRVRWSAPTR